MLKIIEAIERMLPNENGTNKFFIELDNNGQKYSVILPGRVLSDKIAIEKKISNLLKYLDINVKITSVRAF